MHPIYSSDKHLKSLNISKGKKLTEMYLAMYKQLTNVELVISDEEEESVIPSKVESDDDQSEVGVFLTSMPPIKENKA